MGHQMYPSKNENGIPVGYGGILWDMVGLKIPLGLDWDLKNNPSKSQYEIVHYWDFSEIYWDIVECSGITWDRLGFYSKWDNNPSLTNLIQK